MLLKKWISRISSENKYFCNWKSVLRGGSTKVVCDIFFTIWGNQEYFLFLKNTRDIS
jgi:hypothetical protein